MKIYLLISLTLLMFLGCHEIKVGFLVVDEASYNPDSLVVRTKLDTASGIFNPEFQKWLDFGYNYIYIRDSLHINERIDYGNDYEWAVLKGKSWISTPIEGVQGTRPIYIEIKDIRSEDGDAGMMKRELKVRADGTFLLPTFVRSSVGRYVVSLRFYNEGYSKERDNVFTVIVKE